MFSIIPLICEGYLHKKHYSGPLIFIKPEPNENMRKDDLLQDSGYDISIVMILPKPAISNTPM